MDLTTWGVWSDVPVDGMVSSEPVERPKAGWALARSLEWMRIALSPTGRLAGSEILSSVVSRRSHRRWRRLVSASPVSLMR